MNAMEKVAWAELCISVGAMITVTALYPVLGSGATGAFGLLGLLGGTVWFVRNRGRSVVVDERDREIERRATFFGIHVAWMALFLSLITVVVWSGWYDIQTVSVRLLTWFVWIQFAVCYAVKGGVAVFLYRRPGRAA